ncbi:hypothetical protein GG797_21165 [Salmonella enterica]|nr:hypothetical protein [Salmonella enterica]EDS1445440.1 hypothetical protein [Salmonella enterica subsp. enterica serovar Enteritidis]
MRKIRQTQEDFVRLLIITACILREAVVLPVKISLIRQPELPEISLPDSHSVAELSYPQITARDLSINLQPSCLQSASRPDFKVRDFL